MLSTNVTCVWGGVGAKVRLALEKASLSREHALLEYALHQAQNASSEHVAAIKGRHR